MQEADASRAEIWRKIQAAKLNNSKRHQVWAVPPLFLDIASLISAQDVPVCRTGKGLLVQFIFYYMQ